MELTRDEIEDIRFCLGKVAQQNEDWADTANEKTALSLRRQAERFRELARKISK